MEKLLIFFSMAAIDSIKMETNRWLPANLFPLLTHCISAAGRPHNSEKFSWHQIKGYMRKGGSFPGRRMVGKRNISYFQKWFHENTSIFITTAVQMKSENAICYDMRAGNLVYRDIPEVALYVDADGKKG